MDKMKHTLFLYSKFSNGSDTLIKQISNYPDELQKLLNIVYICIDNTEVRHQITNNDSVKITYVPCVINIHDDGNVEVYESDDAFKWITNIEENYTNQQFIAETEQTEKESVQKQIYIQAQQIQHLLQSHKQLELELTLKANTKGKHTPLYEEEKEEEKHTPLYEEPTGPSEVSQPVKKQSANAKKGNDLMSAAMAMQKERDSLNGSLTKKNH